MARPIPVTVLSGYLGAGKTTILNAVLAQDHGCRLAVLVNDFGKVNIDAGLVRNTSGDTIELTNGCVCCTIGDDLGDALDRLAHAEAPPDHVVIEASGVTDPRRVAMQSGYWAGFGLSSIVVAVDLDTIRARARDKFVSRLVLSQLAAAHVIATTKEDLVAPDTARQTRDWLCAVNRRARLCPAPHGRLPAGVLLRPAVPRAATAPGRAPQAAQLRTGQAGQTQGGQAQNRPATGGAAHQGGGHQAGGHQGAAHQGAGHGFHSSVWRAPAPVRMEALKAALRELPETIHRVKGTVIDARTGDPVLVQMVGRRMELSPGTDRSDPCLALIAAQDGDAILQARARLSGACIEIGGGARPAFRGQP